MCRAVNSTLQRKLKVPCHVRSVSLLHERFSPQNVEDLMTFGDKVMFHAAKTTVRIMELRPEELDLSVDQVRYDPVVRGVFESYFLQVEEDLRRKVSTASTLYTQARKILIHRSRHGELDSDELMETLALVDHVNYNNLDVFRKVFG